MSQVNFFMTADDENAFLDMLLSRVDTHVLLGGFFDSSSPIPLLSKAKVGKVKELTLVNKDIMPQPIASGPGEGELAGKYLFDMFYDPAIQLTRSHLSKDRLVSGRIYAKIGWLKRKEANAVYKSWYGSIERWLKKRYHRVNNDWWFGPSAWEWSKAGGICCYGDELAFAGSLADLRLESS